MRKIIQKLRLWLLRKLAMGRPVMLNVSVNGLCDLRKSDHWGVVADCDFDGALNVVVISTKR